jgi:EAL domain-containing protein (putative c-di-GMP-specific phosphodiesterase class I)
MARALTMTTLAKGIETAEQAALMAALGCDHGQGWLYGRPMTAAALDRWIEHDASDSLV